MAKANKYHERFLNSFTNELLVGLFSRYHKASKEITESWALLEASKRFVPNLANYKVVVVGDGSSPRTGALLAYYTKAEVISVDPGLNWPHWQEHVAKQTAMGYPPERLLAVKDRIEDVKIDCEGKPCLVLWPHSHADMRRTKILNHTSRIDIAMPCCVPIPPEWMKTPHVCYIDEHVLSPKNTIHIFGLTK